MTSAMNLDQRITLQQRGSTQDDHGQLVAAWVDVATVWAHVRANPQRSAQLSAEPVGTAFIIVTIRAREVTAGQRMMWRGQAWDIIGQPLPVDRAWMRFEAQVQFRDAARELAA